VDTVQLGYSDRTIVGPPDHLIAERKRLGLDHLDEVWDGVYHMPPHPNIGHQVLVSRLLMLWHPLAEAAGQMVLHEVDVYPPTGVTRRQYRVPDLAVFDPAVTPDAGIVGSAALVVEVRSPGDESYLKLPYFDEIGIGEVLIIDRDTKAVRRWARDVGGPLLEQAPDDDGGHRLEALPVRLRGGDGELVVAIGDDVTVL
jgi:Uma2 family endonuclease